MLLCFRAHTLNEPSLRFLTSFEFSVNNETVSDNTLISKILRPNEKAMDIFLVPCDYTQDSLFDHLNYTLSFRESLPIKISNTKFRKIGECDLKAMFAAQKNQTMERPFCKSVCMNSFNPPSPLRLLQGDICYLDVITYKGKKFSITANTAGFWLNRCNGSKFDPTQASPSHFSHNFYDIILAISPDLSKSVIVKKVSTIHNTRWCSEPINDKDFHESFFNQKNMLLSSFRDWSSDYVKIKAILPKSTNMERLDRDARLNHVFSEFLESVVTGAIAINQRSVPPVNAQEDSSSFIYIINNIFYCLVIETMDPDNNLCTSYFDARKSAKHDSFSSHMVDDLNIEDLNTVLNVLVDIEGHRYLCQCCVSLYSNLLSGESIKLIKYGSEAWNMKPFNSDKKTVSILKKVGSSFHLKFHKFTDCDGNCIDIPVSIFSKIVHAPDDRYYFMDYMRMLPPDPEWLDSISMTNYVHVFRRELIERYTQLKRAQSLISKHAQGTPSGESKTQTTDTDDFIDSLPKLKSKLDDLVSGSISFNLDAFVFKQYEEDKADIHELGAFLHEFVIPDFVSNCKKMILDPFPIDGRSLTDLLHSKGINIRYLGNIITFFEQGSFFYITCLIEMIARTAKHYFNSILRNTSKKNMAVTIIRELNLLFGHDQTNIVWSDIRNKLFEHFKFQLSDNFVLDNNMRLQLLRSFCLKVGLEIVCRQYKWDVEEPFVLDDIIQLHPILYAPYTVSQDVVLVIKKGREFVSKQQYEHAKSLFFSSFKMLQMIGATSSPLLVETLSLISQCFFHSNDYKFAIEFRKMALEASETIHGVDHYITLNNRNALTLYLQQFKQYAVALNQGYAILALCPIVCGKLHPFTASIHSRLASIHQEISADSSEAIAHYRDAYSISSLTFGENHLQTAIYGHFLSICLSATSLTDAIEISKKAKEIFDRFNHNLAFECQELINVWSVRLNSMISEDKKKEEPKSVVSKFLKSRKN